MQPRLQLLQALHSCIRMHAYSSTHLPHQSCMAVELLIRGAPAILCTCMLPVNATCATLHLSRLPLEHCRTACVQVRKQGRLPAVQAPQGVLLHGSRLQPCALDDGRRQMRHTRHVQPCIYPYACMPTHITEAPSFICHFQGIAQCQQASSLHRRQEAANEMAKLQAARKGMERDW